MRIYVHGPDDGRFWGVAPEVPGTASEDVATQREAVDRCRALADEEQAAFARLGTSLEVAPGVEIVEWSAPWWLIPEWLVPVQPGLVRTAVRRMDEIATEVEAFLDGLDADGWDRRDGDEWSVRMILDHVASGFGIGVRQLEPWPLDPARGQEAALEELRERLRELGPRRLVFEQFGLNRENARVRWTPRKVLRVVRSLQEAWLAHLGGDGPEPSVPLGHHDEPGDDDAIAETDLAALVENDERLRLAATRDPRVRRLAIWYRYYRDRLVAWPADTRERWRAVRAAYCRRLLSLSETELALVRLAPTGACNTARQNLGLGISHVREHLAQMRRAKEVAARSHVS